MRRSLVLPGAALLLVACTPNTPPDPRVEAFSRLPLWSGIWLPEGGAAEISGFGSNFAARPGSGGSPVTGWALLYGIDAPWNEAGRAKWQAQLPHLATSKTSGWGYPNMMASGAPLQFLITPEETLVVNMYGEVRHVHTDGRPHPPAEDRWPTTWGDSIGHWEGDTLVIDTIGVRTPGGYAFPSPPLSEDAHYVERLRLTAPGRIESEMTIEDPATLAAPWNIRLVYVRAEGVDRLIHDTFVNDRSEVDGGAWGIEPPGE